MVTTVGAKSGLPRTLPLMRIRDGADPRTFALVASNWGQRHNPAWYHNLKACPHARCSFGGQTGEYEKFWQRAVDAYIGYPLYQQRAGGRHIPIMVMSPEQ
jgi:deazaflavin-dependent oxidoreductase (nitroreductase family)